MYIRYAFTIIALTVVALAPQTTSADDAKSISLDDFSSWREPIGDWVTASDTSLDASDAKRLTWRNGKGIGVNGESGHTRHLLTKLEHGDARVHVEFMVPEGSNSGVYLQGRYEIQVLDSWGVKNLAHSDCGGIYQRFHEGPGVPDNERGYEGRPPRVNASKKPGDWQSFDITFRAPRFDKDGKKIANAMFVKVVHNGLTVHENEELSGPTRAAAWQDESALGPLMLQGDHGPVAYRNIRIRGLDLGDGSDKK